MNTELVGRRIADAVGAVPGVAYLSPHLRPMRTALRRGVRVHSVEGRVAVEIRIAVRSGHCVPAVARAARDVAAEVLDERVASPTLITVAVTAIV